MKIAILGAGRVGRAIALDLAGRYDVCSFDKDALALQRLREEAPHIGTFQVNLQQWDRYAEWLKGFDLLVTAVPGFMGFRTLEAAIRCGLPVADISFFPEDALELDELARRVGVTVITDIGVAPGMSNLILGRVDQEMQVDRFDCYVGGLPVKREPPFQYKAPFSPADVLEEYLRPARLRQQGQLLVKPALSDLELLDFPIPGQLEAFNTDGLRTLLSTMAHIPDLSEKTLRYPGHAYLIGALKEAGFFSKESIAGPAGPLVPLEASAAILTRNWQMEPEDEDITVMKVRMEGEKAGKPVWVQYDLLDHYDREQQISSMARSTGYTCAAAASLMAEGIFNQKGVFPPEKLGQQVECFQFMLDYLDQRGVHWQKTTGPVESWPG